MTGEAAENLALGALDWLLGSARSTEAGLAWAATVPGDDIDFSLYHGSAGIVLALLEAQGHFGDDRYGDAAVRGAAAIAAAVDDVENCSLYFGLTGMAVALHAAHVQLGDSPAAAAAGRALDRVRSRFDGQRWGAMFELLGGNAGIALGALRADDLELAVLAVEPYLRTADPTPGGVNWAVRPGPARSHHIAHGTLGIVYALAAVGAAVGRRDLIDLALQGAADVVARDEAGPEGFVVPHSDPQHRPDVIERYSYGWCNGPAGDAQVFRLLGAVTKDPAWAELAGRCWHTVTHCGLPRRIRPGFWDNSGRCCGTAGVLALACDRHVEQADGIGFAEVLVQDLADRATIDADGVRWSNHEHRATPTALDPRTGWAMGNAGIIRELLRFARLEVTLSRSAATSSSGRSAVEDRPADLVPQSLVLKHQPANRFRELVTLPPALESTRSVSLAVWRGSTRGLDRIGCRTEFVSGDVRHGPGLASRVGGVTCCPSLVSRRRHGMTARRPGLHHLDLAPNPGTGVLDGLTRSRIGGVSGFKQVQDMLSA